MVEAEPGREASDRGEIPKGDTGPEQLLEAGVGEGRVALPGTTQPVELPPLHLKGIGVGGGGPEPLDGLTGQGAVSSPTLTVRASRSCEAEKARQPAIAATSASVLRKVATSKPSRSSRLDAMRRRSAGDSPRGDRKITLPLAMKVSTWVNLNRSKIRRNSAIVTV